MAGSAPFPLKFQTVEFLHDHELKKKIRNPDYVGPIKKQLQGIVYEQKQENARKRFPPRFLITVDGTASLYNVDIDPKSRAFMQSKQQAPLSPTIRPLVAKETLSLENDIANSLVDHFARHVKNIGQVYEIDIVGLGSFLFFLTFSLARLIEQSPSGRGQTRYPEAWLLQVLHAMVKAEVLTAKQGHHL